MDLENFKGKVDVNKQGNRCMENEMNKRKQK